MQRLSVAFFFCIVLALCLLNSCSDRSLKPLFKNGGGATDLNGNTYKSIIIDTLEWLSENLRTSTYANGEAIPNVSDATWGDIGQGAWCFYQNNSQFNDPYGKLYNWYAVADGRKLCPSGWHVPSNYEWTLLQNYLGGGDVAGGKLKEIGTIHWASPNSGASNLSGFTGLPGGDRRGATNSVFEVITTLGRHWSSTPINTNEAYGFDLSGGATNLGKNQFNRSYGFSVRCVRDY